MAGPAIPSGIVSFATIAAVGKGVALPAGAEIVDARGRFVMPGIIDAMTYYGLRPQALNDRENPLTPENRALRGFYPFGEFLRGPGGIAVDREMLSGGVTTVYIAPGDQQVIGGQGAVVKTWGGPSTASFCASRRPSIWPSAIRLVRAGEGRRNLHPDGDRQATPQIAPTQEYAGSAANTKPSPRTKAKHASSAGSRPEPGFLDRKIPARLETDYVTTSGPPAPRRVQLRSRHRQRAGACKIKDVLQAVDRRCAGTPSHPFVQGGSEHDPDLYEEMSETNARDLIRAGETAIASFGFSFGPFGQGDPEPLAPRGGLRDRLQRLRR
jgi:hypothetical protein